MLVEAVNQVASTGDPTAHAEIMAVRQLVDGGRSSLAGCDVCVTAHPCPMRLGALYCAAPDQATSYAEHAKSPADRSLPARQADVGDPWEPFRAWADAHHGD